MYIKQTYCFIITLSIEGRKKTNFIGSQSKCPIISMHLVNECLMHSNYNITIFSKHPKSPRKYGRYMRVLLTYSVNFIFGLAFKSSSDSSLSSRCWESDLSSSLICFPDGVYLAGSGTFGGLPFLTLFGVIKFVDFAPNSKVRTLG